MAKYLLGRVGQAALVLWAAFTVTFVLLHVLPGDAILIKYQNPDLGLGPQQIADIRASYGADQPLWAQYGHAIGAFLNGDFGYSLQAGVPVAASIRTNLPPTLWLTGLGFLLAMGIAATIAFAASLAPFTWLRATIRSLPSLCVSIPTFWFGIALIQLFSFRLRLFPVIGAEGWRGLVLPVMTLAIPISAPLAQILVRGIDEVTTRPFVAVARAKGASHAWVLWRHVFRNAIPPALTIAGVLFGELLGGAIITETVFGLNGIGRMTQEAVNNQDAAVLQAVAVLSASGFVVINLLVDLLYPLLDPRLTRKGPVPS